MTIEEILSDSINKLMQNNKKSPHLEAEILLSHIIKKPREYILAHSEKLLTKPQHTHYTKCISRRLKGEPIAYIMGQKQFYGYDFIVNKNVLIPRPETELMVDEALNLITHNSQPITLIDVGTGSGCIIISLLKKSKAQNLKSKIQFYAIDISKPALSIAYKNARLHKVSNKIKIFHGNLLVPVMKNSLFTIHRSQFIILANLPYLTPKQTKQSPTIKFEPKLALSAGKDGLKYFRILFKQIKIMQKIFSASGYVLCEIDPSQKPKIIKLIKNILPKAIIKIKKDLKGHDRLINLIVN
ncbi:MAG: peptide chain release factor N(5)-glutamine methyltransferase [Patescibacteria group bacterium]